MQHLCMGLASCKHDIFLGLLHPYAKPVVGTSMVASSYWQQTAHQHVTSYQAASCIAIVAIDHGTPSTYLDAPLYWKGGLQARERQGQDGDILPLGAPRVWQSALECVELQIYASKKRPQSFPGPVDGACVHVAVNDCSRLADCTAPLSATKGLLVRHVGLCSAPRQHVQGSYISSRCQHSKSCSGLTGSKRSCSTHLRRIMSHAGVEHVSLCSSLRPPCLHRRLTF